MIHHHHYHCMFILIITSFDYLLIHQFMDFHCYVHFAVIFYLNNVFHHFGQLLSFLSYLMLMEGIKCWELYVLYWKCFIESLYQKLGFCLIPEYFKLDQLLQTFCDFEDFLPIDCCFRATGRSPTLVSISAGNHTTISFGAKILRTKPSNNFVDWASQNSAPGLNPDFTWLHILNPFCCQ